MIEEIFVPTWLKHRQTNTKGYGEALKGRKKQPGNIVLKQKTQRNWFRKLHDGFYFPNQTLEQNEEMVIGQLVLLQ